MNDERGRSLLSVYASNGATHPGMRHPDHDRSLQITSSGKDAEGPTLAFFAAAKDDGTGGVLPFLRMGLRDDRRPYVHIDRANGFPLFEAPAKK